MKHIIIALSVVVATFAIFAMLFSVGLIGNTTPQYQGFPVGVQAHRSVDEVNISFEVMRGDNLLPPKGYVYEYVITYSGDEPRAFTWDVLNRMEGSPIFLILEKDKKYEFRYSSDSPPVMCLGTAAIYKKTSMRKFDFWQIANSSDFVGPAPANSNVPPARWAVEEISPKPLEIK